MSRSHGPHRVAGLLVGAILLGLLMFAPSIATATVQVDAGGPAGQQYALPVDSVRGQAAGDPASGVPGSSTAPPLFGQGIRPEGNVRDGLGSDGGNSQGNQQGGRPYGAGAKLTELIDDAGSGTSIRLELIALLGGMLLLGTGAGLIARRSS